jgi:hypothetical protein
MRAMHQSLQNHGPIYGLKSHGPPSSCDFLCRA